MCSLKKMTINQGLEDTEIAAEKKSRGRDLKRRSALVRAWTCWFLAWCI